MLSVVGVRVSGLVLVELGVLVVFGCQSCLKWLFFGLLFFVGRRGVIYL